MDFLAFLAADSARFGEVLAGVDADRAVPSCPAWTASDLLWHLTEVQAFWRRIVEERALAPKAADLTREADYRSALKLFQRESEKLQAVLAATGPATAVWTWADDQTVGFVRRRQAHEALIHRVDAELTAGLSAEAVDKEFASDGVDEVLTVMMSGVPDWADFHPGGDIVAVETTDTGHRWVLEIGAFSGESPDSGKSYESEPAAVLTDATPLSVITGTAGDLDLWLWGRRDSSGITGDHHTVDALRLLASVSTQ